MPHRIPRRSFLSWSVAAAALPMVMTGASPALAAGAVLDDRLAAGTGWRDFLGSLDLVWQSVPTSFYQGPFLGNGGLGVSVYQRSGANRLAFVLGDSRVRDHQAPGGPLWGGARLPVGYLTLQTTGAVTGVDLRLSLWNAELSGFVTTTNGVLSVRAFVHARKDVLVVAAVPASGTETAAWTFTSQAAVSPRQQFYPAQRPADLLSNPAAVTTTTAAGGTCVQDLACGGRTETRWTRRTEADGVTATLLCTVAHSGTDRSASTTAAATMSALGTLDQLAADHRSWWNAFYPSSFVSVPDTKLMSFYWTQLYKAASATRADRPVMATTGPWLEPTPWPAVWWNLNVQLEYWLLYATGHTELDSLSKSMAGNEAGLIASTPQAYRGDSLVLARTSQEDLKSEVSSVPGTTSPVCEAGNLTWALHNVWLAYRHTMDDTLLRNTLFPRLRKAINFYLHFLAKDSAGVYHLPTTYSPEYANTSDCNYDLALIHWGCRTLLAAVDRLGITDPLAPKWRDVLAHLTPPPQDATQGLWIGKDKQLTSSHRHFSHLLWFYPLYELDVTVPANRDLLVKSLAHWQSLTGALQGYSFTGSGSMYALLGNGNSALTQLNKLVTSYVRQNTMYAETGPVIETPLAGAQTMHDMLVQSWGEVIRVFPAVPTAWADVTLHNLTTEGAFRISARRRAGVTEFIRVRSLAGEPCRVRPGGMAGPYSVQPAGATPGPIDWTLQADGVLEITLAAGQEALITKAGTAPALLVAPVATPTKASWGLPPAAGGTPLPIASLLNNDGISWQSATADGDLDSAGYTFPAEEMPTPGLFVSGGVNWTMPGYADGQKNNVVPTGQTISVPTGTYTELHVLGVATQGNATGSVTFTYGDGSTSTAPLNLSDWGRTTTNGELVAVQTTHRHSPSGDHPLRVRLLHQTIPVTGTAPLTSIRLPSHGRMHLFGLTLR
ncbi:alpha-L-fucosidase 2 [Actinokineospora alba]|uniref:Alpha-L-fucosidase 2 n=1 Tax=Actinokineospora alba TaxID=504798 RepID=A0A1H0GD61_9PSEU|nr:Tat pathway signal sequence domain protein [Actinokineospora alba]TDP69848.1 alpha-L-fucosidase 2 [Actinokineospora alba]SDI07353.1 alpha-L-fucosidase 2 [Actinokineospora alba]SDO04790.1 alpha-L-fucosidase 2 [Actinokineospora alba]